MNNIIVHTDKIEIINKNNESIYYDNEDKTEIITVAKVASYSFFTILRMPCPKLTHSLLTLKNVLNTSNNFIVVGVRNPVDRNLSYFYNISNVPNNTVSKLFQTKKNNYQSQIITFTEKTIDKSISDTINLYFNTDIHNQFTEWFTEFFEITGINQNTFNKQEGLDFYNLSNNNKIMIYTLEKLSDNINNINKIFRLEQESSHIRSFYNAFSSQNTEWKDHYNTIQTQITYTQTYLDSQLNNNIVKFFYSDSDIQNFYNKYTIQN